MSYFTVNVIRDNKEGKTFVVDMKGLNLLMSTATPFKVHFKVQRVR